MHEALGTSQRLGFLGARPIAEVIEHAQAFVAALDDVHGSVIDLGSGGGVPGLVVAIERPDLRIVLLDRRTKRTDFLERAVRRLDISDRVEVIAADIDDALRDGLGGFDAAVARGFGPPGWTLRRAVRCIREGGAVIVSEPPIGDRWDAELIESLQLKRIAADPRVVKFVRLGSSER